jgi:outer membrane protein assembly factor BamB
MMTKSGSTNRLAGYIAMVSAVFSLVLCVLIIVNYIQIKRSDPLNSTVLKVMTERVHANPEDEQLRAEIREIDLLSRKAYFTNQWQVRMGGYLLFFSLLIVVICVKFIELNTKLIPEVPAKEKPEFWYDRKITRSWVAYSGITLVIISLMIVFLTHRELGNNLDRELASQQSGATSKEPGTKNVNEAAQDSGNQPVPENGKADSTGGLDTIASASAMNMDGYPTSREITMNFPAFRGPGGNGIAFQKNIPVNWDGKSGKNIRWKTEIPLPGYNSPIIWNDRVFLTGASEAKRVVYCLDLNTGKLLWSKDAGKIPGSPAQEPKFIRETGLSAPTMTTDGRRVYAIFANGDLLALDFEGNQVWAKNLGMPQNHYGHSSSLIMYQDLLIVQYDQRGSGNVMAFRGKTGEMAWQTNRSVKVSWASPVLVNTGKRMGLILAADPMIVSYNPANGKEWWRMNCIAGEVGPGVAYADGMVYSVNDFSKLSAIEIGDPPKLLWEDSDYLSDIPSPLATQKYLFLVTSYGAVVCYDAKNGTKYWEKELETPTFASPVLAEGKVFLLDKKGIMHIFLADQAYSVIGQPALGEGSSCTPAFADGKIIIRGDKHLFCIGK